MLILALADVLIYVIGYFLLPRKINSYASLLYMIFMPIGVFVLFLLLIGALLRNSVDMFDLVAANLFLSFSSWYLILFISDFGSMLKNGAAALQFFHNKETAHMLGTVFNKAKKAYPIISVVYFAIQIRMMLDLG